MDQIEVKNIILNKYIYNKKIGNYKDSSLKIFKEKSDGKLVFVKVIRKNDSIVKNIVNNYINEIKILNELNNPFICHLQGICQTEKYLYMFFDYCKGGDFFKYLRLVDKVDEESGKFYIGQIILAFDYLHSKNIIYRNLKPENLFFDELGYLKIFNFEISKLTMEKSITVSGTPEYLAPEILMQKGHGKPADWWTLGIFFYEILVGIDPFCDDDPMKIYENIVNLKLKFPNTIENKSKSLIRKLLVIDITKRLGNLKGGIDDIKNHKLFKNFNFEDLKLKRINSTYKPNLKENQNNFREYPESQELVKSVIKENDPFNKF